MQTQGSGMAIAAGVGRGRRALSRFRRDTRGTLTVFVLMLFMLMIMMGGIAVDVMRYEARRTSLQNTLDRSTLAAASLTQELDPTSVVNDYFLKAGLSEYLTSVVVEEGENYRQVTADAKADSQPYFLHLLGISEFDADGHSRAEQRIDNVEVVLVLDISGSMSGTKIAKVIVAANDFIDTVLNSDPDQKISIGIVPYNAQVNLPPELAAHFNVTQDNGVSDHNCLEIPASVFTVPAIDLTLAIPEMAKADTVSSTSKWTSFVSTASGAPNFDNAYCRAGTMNQILMPTNNATTLHDKIDALTADGYTSIMYGMRWGLQLLDPTMQPVFNSLIADGDMEANLQDHPFSYTENGTLKVIVLMTDGEHTQHEMIDDAYKTGASPIYLSTGDSRYSIQHTSGRPASAGANEYYIPATNTWQATPWDSGAGTVQLDWRDVWATFRDSYVAWQFYARALGTSDSTRSSTYNSTISAFENTYGATTTMDTRLQEVCTEAKDSRVVVYGIAFEAPSIGKTQIKNCSTSTAHYYDATTVTIVTTFKAIANNISQLRLTQ